MRSRQWNKILAGLLAAPIPLVVHAETYLNEAQATDVLFPGIHMEPRWTDLSSAQIKTIEKNSHEKVPASRVRWFRGPNGEAVIIDRVLGKHEFITYAVGINPDGKIRGVEIMDYRETFGYQVRNADWRKQFVGKDAHDPIEIDHDIRNISGATISSVHITNGVRRVIQTYAILQQQS